MIVVEATVWIDLFRGLVNPYTRWLDRNLGHPGLSLTDLTLCEVLQGVRTPAECLAARTRLMPFGIHTTGGIELAIHAADNYLRLRNRGIIVRKTIDCLIATYCIRGGHDILHRDRDYDSFEKHLGLSVIHP